LPININVFQLQHAWQGVIFALSIAYGSDSHLYCAAAHYKNVNNFAAQFHAIKQIWSRISFFNAM